MIELPRVAETIDRFTGRTWLLPRLIEWWGHSNERLLLLTGSPGTGKSMVISWLAGFGPEPQDALTREQLSRLRMMVKAAHFCQAGSRNITPQAFAESIVNQLIGTVTGFGNVLKTTLADRVSIVGTAQANMASAGASLIGVAIGRIDLGALEDEEQSFDRAFARPLKELYASGYGEPMLLLVDALAEADAYTGVKLSDLLSRLSDLPTPIRILGTTRDEPRVLKFFRGVRSFDLIKSADPDVDDVQTYAEGRLAGLAAVDALKRQAFARRLAKQADGHFLYAAMVLDDLLGAPLAEPPKLDSQLLPCGLGGLYHAFLTRELGKDEQRWFNLYEPLLGLIAVAQGEGLSSKQLSDIFGVDMRPALRATKQYLTGELPDGPFLPFHKSFADFLLEDSENIHYHIDAQEMHRRVAALYAKFNHDWSNCDPYGIANVAYHLASSNQLKRLAELIENVSFCKAAALHLKDGLRIKLFLQYVLRQIPEDLIAGSRRLSHIAAEESWPSTWQQNTVVSFSQCLAHIFVPGVHDNSGSKPYRDEMTKCVQCGEKQLVHERYWDEASPHDEAYFHYSLCLSCFNSYFARNTTWTDSGPVRWNPDKNAYLDN